MAFLDKYILLSGLGWRDEVLWLLSPKILLTLQQRPLGWSWNFIDHFELDNQYCIQSIDSKDVQTEFKKHSLKILTYIIIIKAWFLNIRHNINQMSYIVNSGAGTI